METANRVLTANVIAALRYWPGVIWAGQKNPPDPVDMTVLPPFFNEVLQDLPWWNRDWNVDRIQPGLPAETGDHLCDPAVRFTEVSIPGTVASGNGESLPFVAKVGFTGDRLIRFQAKIGDVVIGPAVAPAGLSEPHPFGRVLTRLMDLRGIPVKDMARAAGLSMSTIHIAPPRAQPESGAGPPDRRDPGHVRSGPQSHRRTRRPQLQELTVGDATRRRWCCVKRRSPGAGTQGKG